MHCSDLIALLTFIVPAAAVAQTPGTRARASWQGAEFAIPLRLLSQERGNIAWEVSWTVGHPPAGCVGAGGDCGILVGVPDTVLPAAGTAERLQHARITYFWTTTLGSIGAIADVVEPGAAAGLVGDTVVIIVAPGSALNSLMYARPDSLRVAGRAGGPAVAWLRVEYP
jgi:hypothetical protein